MLSLFFYFFYGDYASFVITSSPWSLHGGGWYDGRFTGSFYFNNNNGGVNNGNGSRLV